jgi:hypothetical protein
VRVLAVGPAGLQGQASLGLEGLAAPPALCPEQDQATASVRQHLSTFSAREGWGPRSLTILLLPAALILLLGLLLLGLLLALRRRAVPDPGAATDLWAAYTSLPYGTPRPHRAAALLPPAYASLPYGTPRPHRALLRVEPALSTEDSSPLYEEIDYASALSSSDVSTYTSASQSSSQPRYYNCPKLPLNIKSFPLREVAQCAMISSVVTIPA